MAFKSLTEGSGNISLASMPPLHPGVDTTDHKEPL
ncbi:hypothetical protein CJA_0034 [Cellvibrio japonicus Ueda107]|uniref:Uncharacterized protein n=1 Tax=Cellvibrio japonicus (strain Ueda107) TaxID=498211 RepID=B3PFB8_CELJU|nr:hypothetical protein CJA_0034 [Cellvibrio japonicus Ueda107]